MRRHLLRAALAAAALAILPAAAGAATDHSRPAAVIPPGVEKATLGFTADHTCVVTITKGKTTIGTVPDPAFDDCIFGAQVSVVRMVATRRYEDVVIDSDSHGPLGCCTSAIDLAFQNGQWVTGEHNFGATDFTIVDLNKTRMGFEARHLLLGPSALPDSFNDGPLQFFDDQHGVFVDVTRPQRTSLEIDAANQLAEYRADQDNALEGQDDELPLATWVAEESLLGNRKSAVTFLDSEAATGAVKDPTNNVVTADDVLALLASAGY